MPRPTADTALHEALAAAGEPPRTTLETHTAWVVLTDAHAYKVKKPVRFDFVDLSTPKRRRALCHEEVRLNRPLAAGLEHTVLALVEDDRGWTLDADDAPGAAEWLVRMRRFDEADTLAARLAAGTVVDDDLDRVARRIAAFHRDAEPRPRGRFDDDFAARLTTNLGELEAAGGASVDDERGRRIAALARLPAAVLPTHAPVLRERGILGRVVDGHGDLRAEHVLLEDGDVLVFDRLEFDPALRTVDVADDLAFLTTDLEALGARAAAQRLTDRYRAHGGDPGPPALRALYGAHRAAIRAKVTLLRAAQHPADADADQVRVLALLGLAERLAWRAREPLAIVVHGPPASGKSTLARALEDRTGLAVLSSDHVRKELLDLDLDDRAPDEAYGPAARADVYAELGRRTAAALDDGCSVIVDATFGDLPLRAAFLDALGGSRPRHRLRSVACEAPLDVLARRAATRTRSDAAGSDAGPAIAERLARTATAFDELPAAARTTVSTSDRPDRTADLVLRRLDA